MWIRRRKNLFVFLIFLFHVIFSILWLKSTPYVPLADEADRLYISIKFYEKLKNFHIIDFLKTTPHRGPLFPLSTIPFYFLFGISRESAILVNFIFLAILLISIYKIGELFYKDVGILAAFTISMFPSIWWFSKTFYADLALAAIFTLSIYFLILTNFFKKKNYSILFGISLGFSFWINFHSLLYILPPLIYTLIKSKLQRENIINFLISISLGIFIIFFWLFPNFSFFLQRAYEATEFSLSPLKLLLQPRYYLNPSIYLYYLVDLPKQISFGYYCLFIFSLIFLIYQFYRKTIKVEIVLALIIFLSSYFVFTIIPIKDFRAMIPVLPFIGVLIVSPFSEIKNIRIKFLFIFLILVIGFITFLKELNSREFLGTITLSLKINETEVINLIDLIKNSSIEKKAYGIVFPLELPTTFKYYAKLKDFELETGGTYYWLNKSLYPNILGIDYLLVTENEKFWGPITAKEAFREILIMLKNKSHEINSYFKLVGEYSLTDELKIKLYKNFKVIPLSKSEMEAFL